MPEQLRQDNLEENPGQIPSEKIHVAKNPENTTVESVISKKPDRILGDGGLPKDLINAVSALHTWADLYRREEVSEETMQDELKKAKTFDDYYRGKIENENRGRQKNGEQPYNEQKSILSQRNIVANNRLIEEFDEKVLELRAMAENGKTITADAIDKIILGEIQLLIYGKKRPKKAQSKN